MKQYLLTALCAVLLSSCNQFDKFTGLWNKDLNEQYDAVAFPTWLDKGMKSVDPRKVHTPVFIRIRKEIGHYALHVYRYDAAAKAVVADASLFDFVKLKKVDDNTLLSDNDASGMYTTKHITLRLDPATGKLSMEFPAEKDELPKDKRARAMYYSLFNSTYSKLLDIRRRTPDGGLIDKKLKEEKLIYDN